jgi:hypothetical protein
MIDEPNKIFELRFYEVACGRDADMRARVRNDLRWLFPRHGIRPLGCWSAVVAPSLPMFVYITPFQDMNERNKCWAGFYGDPDWQEVRNRTNAGSELVENFEIYFVRSLCAWKPIASADYALDEIVFLRTLVGKSLASSEALVESEAPALERAGASVMGQFDIMSGRILPSAVSFLRWKDWQTRRNAEQVLAKDERLHAKRDAERNLFGRPLIERKGSYLLEAVTVEWEL